MGVREAESSQLNDLFGFWVLGNKLLLDVASSPFCFVDFEIWVCWVCFGLQLLYSVVMMMEKRREKNGGCLKKQRRVRVRYPERKKIKRGDNIR